MGCVFLLLSFVSVCGPFGHASVAMLRYVVVLFFTHVHDIHQ